MPPRNQPQPTATGAAPDPGTPAVVGGPGGDPTGDPVQPQGIEVVLNGRKFMVTEEVAQAMNVRDRQIDAKLSENSRELGELRKLRPPDPNPSPNPDPDPEPQPPNRGADRIFDDPEGYLTEREKAQEDRIVTRMTTAYRRDRQQEDFWTDLYRTNTDLDRETDHTLVRGVMQDNYAEIEHMAPREAIKKIADLTRDKILGMSRRMKAQSPEGQPSRTIMEPSGGPTSSPQPSNDDKRPTTLGGVIKERQAKRAAARAGRTA